MLFSSGRSGCLTFGQIRHFGLDPWFDMLTTLSEVEGESRKVAENQVILDPGSHPAPRDLAGMTHGGGIFIQNKHPLLTVAIKRS
jgi:hypothetical protein